MEREHGDFWRSTFLLTLVLLWSKLALLRYFLFGEVLVTKLATDLAALLLILGLVELLAPRRTKRGFYWGANLVFSFIFFAAVVYYSHFGTVVTYTSVFEMKQLKQVSSSVKSTIDPVDFVFFLDIVLFVIIRLLSRGQSRHIMDSRPLRKWVVGVLGMLGLLYSVWTSQKAVSIPNELVRAEEVGFINYQAVAVYDNLYESNLGNIKSVAELMPIIQRGESRFPYVKQAAANAAPEYFGSQQGKNVIVVQLEAFQNFPINLSVGGQVLTPVLNSLKDQSYYFPHIFQQIGQGNTSDAEFMSNTSIYPTGTIPMSTGFGDRKLPSLPRLLEDQKYEADTFHVNVVTFWDRNKLYPAIGFTHYYDKPYYIDDHFNSFGASDEELYREVTKVLTGLKDKQQPFYAQLITVSSHHPFVIPEDKKRIPIPATLKGKQLGDYLLAINYTDYALGTFIDQLKANGLWDNSIFVAYGDHFGLQPEDNKPEWVSSELGITYHPELSRFNIPLFIHVPGQTKGVVVDQVGGQLDIMPTIANLLGIPLDQKQFVHFGHDLLNINKNLFGVRYYMPTGSFFNDEIMFIPGKGFADGTAYNIRTTEQVKDFSVYERDYNYILKRMDVSDRYVKLLPKRE